MADRLDLVTLRDHIDDAYDADEVSRGLAGLEKRIHRRKVAGYTASAVAVLALAFVTWRFESTPVAKAPTLVTEDGSVATALSSDTELRVQSQAAEQVELALTRGRGHFEVTRNPRRRYRVRAGEVTVEVLGTAFEVTRRAHDTQVRVEHGLVKVSWPHGETLLEAGEQGVFPPAPVPQVEVAPVVVAEPVIVADPVLAPALAPAPAPAKAKHEDWRALARAGKHREAFGSLGKRPVQDLDGLLLAADAARLSGHPREAAQHLEQLVHKYPESAPARLAAFTLGRLQLNELADPGHAARSFARAYALDPRGPLAEDALAREAEAYRKAGNRERAAEVAARYLAHFPSGGRRAEMSAYLAP